MSTLSITRLYGLGLTPGKLRGLQRISNANGTLTMVATDQNSSMISMMKKATGKEPTYAEIADAKVMLSRALSPHCSGLLVDGYYGYCQHGRGLSPCRRAPGCSSASRSPARQERGRRPCGEVEPGWGVAQDQALRGGRRQVARPVRAGRTRLGRAELRIHPPRFTTSASSTTSCSCWSRSTSRTTARTDDSPSKLARKASHRDRHRRSSSAATATCTRPNSPARLGAKPTRN